MVKHVFRIVSLIVITPTINATAGAWLEHIITQHVVPSQPSLTALAQHMPSSAQVASVITGAGALVEDEFATLAQEAGSIDPKMVLNAAIVLAAYEGCKTAYQYFSKPRTLLSDEHPAGGLTREMVALQIHDSQRSLATTRDIFVAKDMINTVVNAIGERQERADVQMQAAMQQFQETEGRINSKVDDTRRVLEERLTDDEGRILVNTRTLAALNQSLSRNSLSIGRLELTVNGSGETPGIVTRWNTLHHKTAVVEAAIRQQAGIIATHTGNIRTLEEHAEELGGQVRELHQHAHDHKPEDTTMIALDPQNLGSHKRPGLLAKIGALFSHHDSDGKN